MCVSIFASNFTVLSNTAYNTEVKSMQNLNKLTFVFKDKSDCALIDNTYKDSKTWVVYFHSTGGSETEIFTSELCYPLWINSIRDAKFGLISFNAFGNSRMHPNTADAIHKVLQYIKKEFKVNRFILVGASQGGTGVLIYSIRYPKDIFATISLASACNPEQQYNDMFTKPNSFSEIVIKSYEASYGDTKEKRQKIFDINNVQKHYKNLTMPLAMSNCADDPINSVNMADELASLLKDKKDFKYFRYDTGGHYRPSLDGFVASWAWLMDYIDKKDKK